MSAQHQTVQGAGHGHNHSHNHGHVHQQNHDANAVSNDNAFEAALRWAKLTESNPDALRKKGMDKLWLIIAAIIVSAVIVWVIAWYINSKKVTPIIDDNADQGRPPASNTQPDAVPPLPVNNEVQLVHNGGDPPAAIQGQPMHQQAQGAFAQPTQAAAFAQPTQAAAFAQPTQAAAFAQPTQAAAFVPPPMNTGFAPPMAAGGGQWGMVRS